MACALPAAVVAELTAQSRAGTTGTLSAVGDPGGLLRLDGGRVTGAESPGAPGVEALLLRSGRVLEASWVAAYQAGASHGRLALELVRRGLVGAAELEAVCLMALFDAAFAIAAGTVEECRWAPAAPTPASADAPTPGPTADWPPERSGSAGRGGREPWTWEVARVDVAELCGETERRLVALAELPTPVRPGRDRLSTAPAGAPSGSTAPGSTAPGAGSHGAGATSWSGTGAWGGSGLRAASGLRRDVLGLADGRRTARDIAFTLGRGVYPVTVEASRLLADGLLRIGGPSQEGGEVRALLAPRHAAPPAVPATGASSGGAHASAGSGPDAARSGAPAGGPFAGPVQLPRRPSRASGS